VFTVLSLSAFMLLLGPSPAQGEFIRVPDDFTTIQAAIDGASAGDTVAVRPSPAGSYKEHVEVDKQLVLLGGWDPTFTTRDRSVYPTIVDGEGVIPQVFKFERGLGKSTVIDGFNITGGVAPQATNLLGGGIYCKECTPTIRNNEIYDNKANFGAGIACIDDADADIIENYIHDNIEIVSSGLAGCGIFARRASPYVAGNTIDRNKGSGVRLEYSDALVEDNYISKNTHGAGVACLDETYAVVRHNIFKDNRAVFGGGIWIENSSPVVEFNILDNNTIEAPEGEGGGAGLSCFGDFGTPAIRNNIFKNNWTTTAGGGIIVMGSTDPFIQDNLFRENNGEVGGAILIQDNASASISGNTFFRNYCTATYGGGTILVRGTAYVYMFNNVVFGSATGGGMAVSQQGSINSHCNCVSNNLPSGYIGMSPDESDVLQNPIFCRTEGDTLDLASNSPCLPQNNESCSELIGKYGLGNCGAFPTNLSLIDPPNDSMLNIDNPTFVWSNSHDPDGGLVTFELEYDTKPTFETAVQVNTVADTFYTIQPGEELLEAVTYYWHATATDDEGASTSSDQVWKLIIDMTSPNFTMGVHQHPYLDTYLDFYVVSNEDLIGDLTASLTIGGSEEDLDMELIDSKERVYYTSFEMTASGTVEFEASGDDLAGNSTLEEDSFSFQILRAASGASFASPDGELTVVVEEGSFSKTACFLVKNLGDGFEAVESLSAGPPSIRQAADEAIADGHAKARSSIYSVTWSPSEGSAPVELRFESDSQPGTDWSICRWTGVDWEPLATYRDPESGDLFCRTSVQGMFQLRGVSGNGYAGPTALLQNYPNPFHSTTTVAFTVAGTEASLKPVSIRVFDVKGRLVKTLLDSELEPGPYAVTWDGRDRKGGTCPSGLYLYRLNVEGEAPIAKKMLLMH
jgi:parallel beta-helix repeat protein